MERSGLFERFFAEHGEAALPTNEENLRRAELGFFVFQSNSWGSKMIMDTGYGQGLSMSVVDNWG